MKNFTTQFYDYLLKEKKFSKHTIHAYLKDVNDFLLFLNNETVLHVKEVRYEHIRKWMIHLSETKMSNNSINRKLASLKSYFKFLYITKTVDVYPLQEHKSLRTKKVLQVPFSEDEMKKIERDMFPNDYFGFQQYLIILLFYALGLRKSELMQLKTTDFDLHKQEVRVLGKGFKERIVPIVADLNKELILFLEERKKQFPLPNHQNIFLLKNGQILNQTFVYRLINNYFRGVTSKQKKSPHVLRHTFATHMLNAGANLNTVKELLGHASLSSTQIYTHTSLAALKKVYTKAHPRFKSNDDEYEP